MSYLNNKVRVEVVNSDNQAYENYIIDSAKSEKEALKVGDVLVIDTTDVFHKQKIVAFYRTDGTYNGKKLKPLKYDSVERNGIKINIKSNKQMKTNKMMGTVLDKFKNLYMPEVAQNLRISMNGLVCVPVDGEYVSIDSNGELVSFPENFTIEMPVYVINRSMKQIQVGDIVARGNNYYKVSEIVKNADGSVKDLKTISYSGFNHTVKAVKDFMLGQKYIKVVINLFNGFNGTSVDPMMLALLQDDDEGNNDFLMSLIAMQAMNPNGGAGLLAGMNPMILMAFAGGNEGGGSNMFQNMLQAMFMTNMMQNMGGGQNNVNPFACFGSMFQTPVNQPTTDKQTLND